MNDQEILDNAPEGATHTSKKGVYYKFNEETPYEPMAWWIRGEEWIETEIDHLTHSLADIRRIAELEQWQQDIYKIVNSSSKKNVLEILKLEQQVAGIEKVLYSHILGLTKRERSILKLMIGKLQSQAKQLKEQDE